MDSIVVAAAVIVSVVAAVTDARTGRIPNRLTVPVAVPALAWHATQDGGWGLVRSACGLAAAAAIPWLAHRLTHGRAIGGGDVKLFAALGALAGPTAGLEIELSAFVLLAAFALVRLAYQGQLLRVLSSALRLALGPLLPRGWRRSTEPEALTEMRMGPAIAAAVVVVTARDVLLGWASWLA